MATKKKTKRTRIPAVVDLQPSTKKPTRFLRSLKELQRFLQVPVSLKKKRAR